MQPIDPQPDADLARSYRALLVQIALEPPPSRILQLARQLQRLIDAQAGR